MTVIVMSMKDWGKEGVREEGGKKRGRERAVIVSKLGRRKGGREGGDGKERM